MLLFYLEVGFHMKGTLLCCIGDDINLLKIYKIYLNYPK